MLPAAGGQRLPEALQGAGVPLVVPVGEVEPGDVHAGVDEGAEGLDTPARGAQGADDLALPAGFIALGEDLVLAVLWVRCAAQAGKACVSKGERGEKETE